MRHSLLGWIVVLGFGAGCAIAAHADEAVTPRRLLDPTAGGGVEKIQGSTHSGHPSLDLSADRKFRSSRDTLGAASSATNTAQPAAYNAARRLRPGSTDRAKSNTSSRRAPTPLAQPKRFNNAPQVRYGSDESASGSSVKAEPTPLATDKTPNLDESLPPRRSSRRVAPNADSPSASSSDEAPGRISASEESQPIGDDEEVWVGDDAPAAKVASRPIAPPTDAPNLGAANDDAVSSDATAEDISLPLTVPSQVSDPIAPTSPIARPIAPADQSSRPIAPADQPTRPITSREDFTGPNTVRETPRANGANTSSLPREKPASDRVLFARKSPVLVVETLGPRQTVIGKEATFQVQLQNLGEVAADGVTIRVDTPEWAEITSAKPSNGTADVMASNADHALSWQVDSLAARETEVLTLTIVPRRSDAFDLGVAWSFKPGTSQTMIEVQEPQLDLAISGPNEVRYGDTKVYQLTVSNPGTGPAELVQVQLMPIEGGERPMAVQDVGTIPAGESKTLEVELTAREAGNIVINAVATGDLDLRADASEEVLVRRAALVVDVVGPEAKFVGALATYKFRIANSGTASADNVHISATLPPGAEVVDSSNGGSLNAEENKITWSVESLGSQREMVFTIKANLKSAGANLVNVDAKADRELADSGSATTMVESLADLKLEVTDPKGPIPINEEMVFELRVWNRGTKAAQNVEIVAFFSEGVEPLSVKGGRHQIGSGQVVFDAIPTLGVGDEVVFKVIARASQSGDHIFRAEVQCREARTRLAAEETTHFYDNPTMTARRPGQ